MKIAALIVAAGRGVRAGAGQGSLPKQYALLAGEPVINHVLRAFAAHPAITVVKAVIHGGDRAIYDATTARMEHALTSPAEGGASRQESVRLGLEALALDPPDRVLIHDAARPFVSADVIDRVVEGLEHRTGAIAAEPVADTLKSAGPDGVITATVDRSSLWRAQTPQGFHFAAILDAHRRAAAAGQSDFTDDAGLAEWAGLEVAIVRGSSRNIKVTTREDLEMAERLMPGVSGALESRTGTGFDVHKFKAGDHVWLGGVRIAHTASLEGHSDADVALHALTDAILGALGDGDIGAHFPPSDPKWKGAASRIFLEDAAARVRARGGRIVNADVTLLAEAPRIGPHRDAMRVAIAEMLGIDASRVGVKATTTEGLGFTGRGEGLAAMATATVLMPA